MIDGVLVPVGLFAAARSLKAVQAGRALAAGGWQELAAKHLCDGGQAHRPDGVQARDQRAAAGLAARKYAELAGKWHQLLVERIDHAQPELDQLSPGRGKVGRRERLPADLAAQPQSGRHALLEELRLHALQ